MEDGSEHSGWAVEHKTHVDDESSIMQWCITVEFLILTAKLIRVACRRQMQTFHTLIISNIEYMYIILNLRRENKVLFTKYGFYFFYLLIR